MYVEPCVAETKVVRQFTKQKWDSKHKTPQFLMREAGRISRRWQTASEVQPPFVPRGRRGREAMRSNSSSFVCRFAKSGFPGASCLAFRTAKWSDVLMDCLRKRLDVDRGSKTFTKISRLSSAWSHQCATDLQRKKIWWEPSLLCPRPTSP